MLQGDPLNATVVEVAPNTQYAIRVSNLSNRPLWLNVLIDGVRALPGWRNLGIFDTRVRIRTSVALSFRNQLLFTLSL